MKILMLHTFHSMIVSAMYNMKILLPHLYKYTKVLFGSFSPPCLLRHVSALESLQRLENQTDFLFLPLNLPYRRGMSVFMC